MPVLFMVADEGTELFHCDSIYLYLLQRPLSMNWKVRATNAMF